MRKYNNIYLIIAALLMLNLFSTSVLALDSDNDTIPDEMDNCVNIPNVEQFDNNNKNISSKIDEEI